MTHTPVSTIEMLFFHLHLGFPNATLRGYRHRYTGYILKCRTAMARRPTVRQLFASHVPPVISKQRRRQQQQQQQQQQQI